MRIFPAKSRGERPTVRLDTTEQRWLYALCRHWQDSPGPARYGGPDAGQVEVLMEAIATYQLCWLEAEDGIRPAHEYIDFPPF